MKCKFHAYGHPNILGTHKTTLEFTKDSELSLKGDCIIGVKADFDLRKLKNLVEKNKNGKIKITIETEGKKISETINAELNSGFNDEKEIVIRKADFVSQRTLAMRSNKAAFELRRDLIGFLKINANKITVILQT